MTLNQQIYRFLRAEPDQATDAAIEEKKQRTADIKPCVFSHISKISECRGQSVVAEDFTLFGALAERIFKGAHAVLFLAVTLGLQSDKFLLAEGAKSAYDLLIADAVLSAVAEFAMEDLNKKTASELEKNGSDLRCGNRRISPGFSDFPLSQQADFVSAFDLQKRMGIHLNESYIFVPQKTITAVVPVFKTER